MKKIKKKVNISYKTASDLRVIVVVDFWYFLEGSEQKSVWKIPMILDTGANITVLNIQFAEKIGFKLDKRRTPQTKITTGSNREQIAYGYVVPKMDLTEIDYGMKNLNIWTYDIPVDAQEYGGILGLDFFKDKKICVDLLNKTLDVT